jgi:plasmid stability protein
LEIPVPVNLSIKNVPDHLAKSLWVRAVRNHRSIQEELLAILEAALAPKQGLDAQQLFAKVRRLKLTTHSQASRMIRADRNER